MAGVVVRASLDLAGPQRQQGLAAVERLDLMGWMAPSRHLRAKLVAVEAHQDRSHPWCHTLTNARFPALPICPPLRLHRERLDELVSDRLPKLVSSSLSPLRAEHAPRWFPRIAARSVGIRPPQLAAAFLVVGAPRARPGASPR